MVLSNGSAGVREVGVAATVTLDHRAYFGRACGEGYAVVSPEGAFTVVDGRLRVVRQGDLGGPAGDFSVTSGSWAWVVEDRLQVGDPVGVERVSAPLAGEASCRWSRSGRALWVAHGTGDEVRVELRTPDLRVTCAVTVPDEFGASSVVLCPHPHPGAVVLWIAAGQDGQRSWLIRADGTELTADLLPADDCRPALFGPDGTWLLAADDNRVVRRSWPDGTELGVLRWADIDPEAAADGSDGPGGDLVLLPGGFLSWNTGNGRLRVIDLSTMSVTGEIAMAGHPVRTVAELYPALVNDHNPCGDFNYAVPGANGTVLSVHRKHTLVLSALKDWAPLS
jgi:hypothetical protein